MMILTPPHQWKWWYLPRRISDDEDTYTDYTDDDDDTYPAKHSSDDDDDTYTATHSSDNDDDDTYPSTYSSDDDDTYNATHSSNDDDNDTYPSTDSSDDDNDTYPATHSSDDDNDTYPATHSSDDDDDGLNERAPQEASQMTKQLLSKVPLTEKKLYFQKKWDSGFGKEFLTFIIFFCNMTIFFMYRDILYVLNYPLKKYDLLLPFPQGCLFFLSIHIFS